MELTNNTTVKAVKAQASPAPPPPPPASAAEAEDIEVETPTITHQIQKPKPFSFGSNGVLKRKNCHQGQPHQHHPVVVVVYRECLKNHAANIGGHAVDGCGEFMPSSTVNLTDPTSLKCAACGCHRNFHRREPEELGPQPGSTPAIEYQPHHRHHPPQPQPQPQPQQLQLLSHGDHSSPDSSPSPPPISSAYYTSSAPHMLLALSAGGFSGEKNQNPVSAPVANHSNSRKRFRTKFTADQKGKMLEFAERVGWKMQKRDEDLVRNFCNEIGVERGVLKVWMHNNKNNFVGKKLEQHHEIFNNNNGTSNSDDNNGFCIVSRNKKGDDSNNQVVINHVVTNNGSSSSS